MFLGRAQRIVIEGVKAGARQIAGDFFLSVYRCRSSLSL